MQSTDASPWEFPAGTSVRDVLLSVISNVEREDREDPFYVVNLGRLVHLHKQWLAVFPTVEPFYAVKCNNDPFLLWTLKALGVGFDCASRSEIKSVMSLGVSPSKIIYANPCKQATHIQYAAKVGVHLMTFDNEDELHKIKRCDPAARLVLRIVADDPTAICNLGVKFGAKMNMVPRLLATAKTLDLSVIGISFHVGSGAQSASAYAMALTLARQSMDIAEGLGFSISLLDIGGGFPGSIDSHKLFEEVGATVGSSMDSMFGHCSNLKVIAEPGRYFACSTHALAVNVTGKRCKTTELGKEFMYYVNDGLYGSFNCILYDHISPVPRLLQVSNDGQLNSTSIWGQTCDGLDKINEGLLLPELTIGDWLYYEHMGAYTVSAHSSFNGFNRPTPYYYYTAEDKKEMQRLLSIPPVEQTSCCHQLAAASDRHSVATVVKEHINCC